MGEVYRATHILMEKTVAIKILRPQLEQREELIERFRREAQAAAHIDHPNICQATDFGQMDDGTFFLVIEYLEGQTLKDRLRLDGPMSPEQAIDIAAQMASALERAHQLDIIHRDLKPENIMLVERDGQQDTVKILDFGVARVRLTEQHADAQLTQAGTVWGTPTYMSPEQATGSEVDGRADLYSLGVILYEMLSGRPPFEGNNSARVMASHVTLKPQTLREICPELRLPDGLEDLVLKLLEKEPDARPQTATELHERLDALSSSSEQSAPKTVLSQRQDNAPKARKDQLITTVKSALYGPFSWFREQPLWAQGSMLGLSAGFFLLITLLPLLFLMSSSEPSAAQNEEKREKIERDLEDERTQFLETADLLDLPIALKEGRTTDALNALDEAEEAYGDNPHFWYLSGRVNAARGRWQASMDAYERTLSAEALYANDDELNEDVFERFADKSATRAADAKKIIERHLDTPAANDRLAEQAKFGRLAAIRKRALDVLMDTGRIDLLERWNQLSVEMNHTKGCVARRPIIEKIVKEGDPRGVEILEKFAKKPTRGCGFLNLEDCYSCMRNDLKKAIKTLETK